MEERARELGGRLTVRSAAGAGTTMTLDTARQSRQPGRTHSAWRRRPAMTAAPVSVLIVDDHAVVREGLRNFLALQDGIEVVGEAADGREALAAEARLSPDVILMDLVMPVLDGVQAMRALHDRGSRSHVIVLTSFLDDDRILPAIRAGAAGYLLKDVEPAELAPGRARRHRRAGDDRPDGRRAAAADAADPRRRRAGRVRRRRRADPARARGAGLLAAGRSNKRIALELGIAEKTVKTHVGHVLAKLGVDADRDARRRCAPVRAGLAGPALAGARRERPMPARVLGPIAPGNRDRAGRSVAAMSTAHDHRSLTRSRSGAGPSARAARLDAGDRRSRRARAGARRRRAVGADRRDRGRRGRERSLASRGAARPSRRPRSTCSSTTPRC